MRHLLALVLLAACGSTASTADRSPPESTTPVDLVVLGDDKVNWAIYTHRGPPAQVKRAGFVLQNDGVEAVRVTVRKLTLLRGLCDSETRVPLKLLDPVIADIPAGGEFDLRLAFEPTWVYEGCFALELDVNGTIVGATAPLRVEREEALDDDI